jgi:hypothetical protein
MITWFEVKLRYEKMLANGTEKKVTESYLIDAMSFTEAEAKAIKEAQGFISGEFTVTAIKRANYSEIWLDESEVYNDEAAPCKFFKGKVVFISLDEKTAKESKSSTYMLVEAHDLQDAKDRIVEKMKGTMADYQIESVSETKIVEVYKYTV